MQKTKIEYVDSTWSPITGCLHGCEYCYARKIANRFAGCDEPSTYWQYHQATWHRVNPDSKPEKAIYEIDAKCPPVNIRFDAKKQQRVVTKAPYPWGFQPTLHRDKLDEPQHWKKPRNIFVCSMADLFGSWVPDSWIEEVLEACEKAPQHRYLFLTKNPARYKKLASAGKLPKKEIFWYGSTLTVPNDNFFHDDSYNTFLSIEPILGDFLPEELLALDYANWVILGAMTGPGSKKHLPTRETVDNICENVGCPVFMKNSLIPVVGEEKMRREFPWD